MTDALEITDFSVRNDRRVVVDGVSLTVPCGEIVALLGPNGAGKSELVLGLAGVLPSSGRAVLGGHSLDKMAVQRRRAAGLAAVPEGHQVFAGLSVRDNLRAAGPSENAAELEAQITVALDIFPELHALLDRRAGALSGGQQQMVAIAQALICRPKILLIDEMSLGLAPVVIERLVAVVRKLRDRGIGILLIEQFTWLALDVADHVHVLARGKLQFSGRPEELRKDHGIIEVAYLG